MKKSKSTIQVGYQAPRKHIFEYRTRCVLYGCFTFMTISFILTMILIQFPQSREFSMALATGWLVLENVGLLVAFAASDLYKGSMREYLPKGYFKQLKLANRLVLTLVLTLGAISQSFFQISLVFLLFRTFCTIYEVSFWVVMVCLTVVNLQILEDIFRALQIKEHEHEIECMFSYDSKNVDFSWPEGLPSKCPESQAEFEEFTQRILQFYQNRQENN